MVRSWMKSRCGAGAALAFALSACGPGADGGEGDASDAMAGSGGAAGMSDSGGAGGSSGAGAGGSGAGGDDEADSCGPGDTPFVHNVIKTGLTSTSMRAPGDLDGDGFAEIIIDGQAFFSTGGHNYEAGGLSIACGEAEYCSVHADTIEAIDLNGDEALDLVLKKSVFLNDGAGSFTWAGDLDVPAPFMFDHLIGDVNGDDVLDIVTLAEDTRACREERTRRENEQVGQLCDASKALREGIQDVCPAGEECFQLPGKSDEGMCHAPRCGFGAVFLGAGDGTFSEASRFDIDVPWWYDNYGDRAVLGDFDGDENPDVVYRVPFSQPEGSMLLRRGAGDGTFGEAEMIEEQGPLNSIDTYAFDIDDDDDLDLLTQPYLLLNDGSGAFTGGEYVGSDVGVQNIRPGDIGGDGRLEAVGSRFTSGSGDYAMSVERLTDGADETLAEWCEPEIVEQVDVADLDGDGSAEVIVAYILKDFRIYTP